jgi:hypothetical protein
MYAIDVYLNSGKKVEALLWSWKPKEGYFEALVESTGAIKKYQLREVRGGKFYSDRIREVSTSEDFLEKAKRDGFEG